VGLAPCLARIVRDEHTARAVLDNRIDTAAVDRRQADPDLAVDAQRHSRIMRQFGPGLSAVHALEQPAPGPARAHAPGFAPRFPKRCIDDLWVVRIDRDVDRAGFRIAVESLLPRLTAVAADKDAALGVGRAIMAKAADQHMVTICGIDPDAREVPDRLQSNALPRLAAVRGFINAVPRHDVAAKLGFSGGKEDDIGIGFADPNAAYSRIVDLAVGDRLPACPAIGGLPQPAADGSKIIFVRTRSASCDRDRPAATIWPDVPPLELREIG